MVSFWGQEERKTEEERGRKKKRRKAKKEERWTHLQGKENLRICEPCKLWEEGSGV